MDYPYIVLILLLSYLTFRSWKLNNRSFYFKWCVVITFLFFAFRACVVGADTYNYTLGFLQKADYYTGDEIEPLYKLYVKVIRNIWKNEVFFIVMNSFLSLFPIYYIVKKESFNAVLSVFTFFIFQIYLPYFVALRQILATAILLVGITIVMKDKRNKWYLYGVCTCLAFFMHNSTLINAILFYLLYFLKLSNRKIAIMIIVATALVGIVFQSLKLSDLFNMYLNLNLGLTTERLNTFIQEDQLNNASSTVNVIWTLRFSILGMFAFYFMDDEKINHWFSKIYLLSVVFSNLFFNVDMIARINLAFNLFSIITFTWGFGERYKQKIKKHEFFKIIGPLVIVFFLQSFIRSQIGYKSDDLSRMHPYYFFWEDYHTHPSITKF